MVRGVDPNAAREIVVAPLEGTGFTLEHADGVDVVGDVARALERDASALPLVQFALARLWDRRDEQVLRAQSWKDIGGILGALGEAAQGLYERLAADEQQAARRLFLALFDVEGTRKVVEESALDAAAVALAPRLADAGLVRRRAEEGGRAVIEPLHEALATGWPQLSRWLEEVRAERELVRDAQREAERWKRNGEPADMLWGGTLLKNAEVLEAIREEPGRSFVAASLAAEKRARKRAFWVGRVLPAAAIAAVLGIALTGWWTTTQAKRQTDEALRKVDAALAESQRSEKRATASEQEALRQKGVAEERQKEAEDAKKKVAELGKDYWDKFTRLSAATDEAIRARSLEKLAEAKRNIEENRPPPPKTTTTSAPKPPASVVPPVGSPFEP